MTKLSLIEKDDSDKLPAAVAPTPMLLLNMAVSQGADLDKLTQLMALQERWEANEARKAFNVAFAAFKEETIKVFRNKDVEDGPLKGKSYAELYSIIDAVTPALAKNGLGHSWKITKDEKDWIEVTCTIRHILGHSESVSMGGPPDVGGAKNAIQARASTVTYLEKYTLKAICGVSERGDDTDANLPGDWLSEVKDINESKTLDELQLRFKAAGEKWKTKKGAMRDIVTAKDNMKRALGMQQ